MAEEGDHDEEDRARFRLARGGGDRGPSLVDRLSDKITRLSFASPVHRLHLRGRFPLKLLAVPKDPVPGDRERGERLKAGRLYRDGYGQAMGAVGFDAREAPLSWLQWVHGWGWLRDLATQAPLSATELKRSELLAKQWLRRFHDYDASAWEPAATGRRILAVIMHAPLVLAGHDHIHRSAMLNGLARWGRHLDHAAPRLHPSFPRLEAAAGLVGCGLILPGGDERAARGEELLAETLAALLPDGAAAIATRSPLDLARLGDLMLTLAAFHRARAQSPSPLIARTLDRVREGLAALAMGDGLPSPWHGGQPDRAQLGRLGVERRDLAPARPSGFHALRAGGTMVMVDAGPPPPVRLSGRGHASTLAFTMTDGARHLVVCCGGAEGPGGPRGFAEELVRGLRSTAGHSTLVLVDTNSSRLEDGGPRRLGGVQEVQVETRANSRGQWFEGSHDGWRRRFGYDHRRRLWLAPDGADFRGEDRLEPKGGRLVHRAHKTSLPFVIRFHLGPDAEATKTEDGHGALLRFRDGVDGASGASTAGRGAGRGGGVWAFRASFGDSPGILAIEPSLFIDAAGKLHETKQLMLQGIVRPGESAGIQWSFRRQ